MGKQVLTLKVAHEKQLDSQPLEVTIGACTTASTVEEETVEESETENQPAAGTTTTTINTGASAGDDNQGTTADTEPITSSAIIETVENPWTKEDMLVGLFIMAIIMTLTLIIIFFIILLK